MSRYDGGIAWEPTIAQIVCAAWAWLSARTAVPRWLVTASSDAPARFFCGRYDDVCIRQKAYESIPSGHAYNDLLGYIRLDLRGYQRFGRLGHC